MCVDPQIGTNSIGKRGVPIWKFFCLPAHFHTGNPYGYGEDSFDAPLSHALITQIFEFWAIQRTPLLTKLGNRRTCKHAPLLTKNFAPNNQLTENYADKGKGGLWRRRC
jgi:hypothetical protein